MTHPNTTVSNHYGTLARDHMARWLPRRFAAIPDPDRYFQLLGERIEAEIATLQQQVLESLPANGPWIERAGQARMSRLMAEDQVLAELVYLTPETDPTEPSTDSTGAWVGSSPGAEPWIPILPGPEIYEDEPL